MNSVVEQKELKIELRKLASSIEHLKKLVDVKMPPEIALAIAINAETIEGFAVSADKVRQKIIARYLPPNDSGERPTPAQISAANSEIDRLYAQSVNVKLFVVDMDMSMARYQDEMGQLEPSIILNLRFMFSVVGGEPSLPVIDFDFGDDEPEVDSPEEEVANE